MKKISSILLGDNKVGKTTLCGLLRGIETNALHKSTVTLDYFSFKTDRVTVSLWDTANGPSIEHILVSFLKSCEVVILVCNNEKYSWDYIEKFMSNYSEKKQVIIVYFQDLNKDSEYIGDEYINNFVEKHNVKLFKIKNYNVEELKNYLINYTENNGYDVKEEDIYAHTKTKRKECLSCCNCL